MQRIFLLAVFAARLPVICCAQQPSPSFAETLAGMSRPDRATRHAAFDNIYGIIMAGQDPDKAGDYSEILANFFARYPQWAEAIKVGLIGLLSADSPAFEDPAAQPGTEAENDTLYWATEIYLVAALQDDRAIPALVGAGSNSAAMGRVLDYGRKALPLVLKELDNPDRFVQSFAFSIAAEIMRADSDPVMHAELLRLVTAGLINQNDLIRRDALWVIEERMPISDQRQLIPALERVARKDPSRGGEPRYPNRIAARRLLDAIKGPPRRHRIALSATAVWWQIATAAHHCKNLSGEYTISGGRRKRRHFCSAAWL
jgi:hypothetical protein